jgi:hypothetical protein
MTTRVTRDHGKLTEITVACDQMDCAKAVNDSEITTGGGLREMGWQATPMEGRMRHYCPDHNRTQGKE